MLKLLVTMLFAMCVQHATAIRCYECTSVNNSMCLDPTIYDTETIQKFMRISDCAPRDSHSSQEYFCRKITQTILHKNHDSEVRVVRGCGWVRSRRDCYKADNEDHLETVCQCFQDGCNGASSTVAPWTLLATGALILYHK